MCRADACRHELFPRVVHYCALCSLDMLQHYASRASSQHHSDRLSSMLMLWDRRGVSDAIVQLRLNPQRHVRLEGMPRSG